LGHRWARSATGGASGPGKLLFQKPRPAGSAVVSAVQEQSWPAGGAGDAGSALDAGGGGGGAPGESVFWGLPIF